jgi:hypothetical protein
MDSVHFDILPPSYKDHKMYQLVSNPPAYKDYRWYVQINSSPPSYMDRDKYQLLSSGQNTNNQTSVWTQGFDTTLIQTILFPSYQ